VKNNSLFHGAFADGSSWSKVIPLLQSKAFVYKGGRNPIDLLSQTMWRHQAPLLPLKRAVILDRPLVFGGLVITEAGNDSKVACLVYVGCLAPDANQTIKRSVSHSPRRSLVPQS